jgi:hypothetical protein
VMACWVELLAFPCIGFDLEAMLVPARVTDQLCWYRYLISAYLSRRKTKLMIANMNVPVSICDLILTSTSSLGVLYLLHKRSTGIGTYR